MTHPEPRTVVVLGTGGTISCTRNAQGDLTPSRRIEDIVTQAHLDQIPGLHVVTHDVMSLDSSALRLEDIDTLMSAVHTALTKTDYPAPLAGVILIHGTDTMEETAMALHEFFPDAPVPLLVTGAQRPFDDPHPDGPVNLRAAAGLLMSLPADHTFPPHIVFGGLILPAQGTTKTHTHSDQGFSFSGPSDPPRVPASHPARLMASDIPAPPPLSGLSVEIIEACAGSSSLVLDAICSAEQQIDGLIIAALGSGNVPPTMVKALSNVSFPIMVCTRVPRGGVNFIYGGDGGGAALQRAGMRSGEHLRPSQARVRLLCEAARRRAKD